MPLNVLKLQKMYDKDTGFYESGFYKHAEYIHNRLGEVADKIKDPKDTAFKQQLREYSEYSNALLYDPHMPEFVKAAAKLEDFQKFLAAPGRDGKSNYAHFMELMDEKDQKYFNDSLSVLDYSLDVGIDLNKLNGGKEPLLPEITTLERHQKVEMRPSAKEAMERQQKEAEERKQKAAAEKEQREAEEKRQQEEAEKERQQEEAERQRQEKLKADQEAEKQREEARRRQQEEEQQRKKEEENRAREEEAQKRQEQREAAEAKKQAERNRENSLDQSAMTLRSLLVKAKNGLDPDSSLAEEVNHFQKTLGAGFRPGTSAGKRKEAREELKNANNFWEDVEDEEIGANGYQRIRNALESEEDRKEFDRSLADVNEALGLGIDVEKLVKNPDMPVKEQEEPEAEQEQEAEVQEEQKAEVQAEQPEINVFEGDQDFHEFLMEEAKEAEAEKESEKKVEEKKEPEKKEPEKKAEVKEEPEKPVEEKKEPEQEAEVQEEQKQVQAGQPAEQPEEYHDTDEFHQYLIEKAKKAEMNRKPALQWIEEEQKNFVNKLEDMGADKFKKSIARIMAARMKVNSTRGKKETLAGEVNEARLNDATEDLEKNPTFKKFMNHVLDGKKNPGLAEKVRKALLPGRRHGGIVEDMFKEYVKTLPPGELSNDPTMKRYMPTMKERIEVLQGYAKSKNENVRAAAAAEIVTLRGMANVEWGKKSRLKAPIPTTDDDVPSLNKEVKDLCKSEAKTILASDAVKDLMGKGHGGQMAEEIRKQDKNRQFPALHKNSIRGQLTECARKALELSKQGNVNEAESMKIISEYCILLEAAGKNFENQHRDAPWSSLDQMQDQKTASQVLSRSFGEKFMKNHFNELHKAMLGDINRDKPKEFMKDQKEVIPKFDDLDKQPQKKGPGQKEKGPGQKGGPEGPGLN